MKYLDAVLTKLTEVRWQILVNGVREEGGDALAAVCTLPEGDGRAGSLVIIGGGTFDPNVEWLDEMIQSYEATGSLGRPSWDAVARQGVVVATNTTLNLIDRQRPNPRDPANSRTEAFLGLALRMGEVTSDEVLQLMLLRCAPDDISRIVSAPPLKTFRCPVVSA